MGRHRHLETHCSTPKFGCHSVNKMVDSKRYNTTRQWTNPFALVPMAKKLREQESVALKSTVANIKCLQLSIHARREDKSSSRAETLSSPSVTRRATTNPPNASRECAGAL